MLKSQKNLFVAIVIIILGILLFFLIKGIWQEGKRTTVCNGEYVLADKYYEAWECAIDNIDFSYIEPRCHYVYTDNQGIVFEVIRWKEYLSMFDNQDSWPKLPIRRPHYETTYKAAIVEARQEQVEELNQEYEEYLAVEEKINPHGGWVYINIVRNQDISDEDWIVYATEYICRLDRIYSFENIETQTDWIESWAQFHSENTMAYVYVEEESIPGFYGGNPNNASRHFSFSNSEEHRLDLDEVYHALYYGYKLDEIGAEYLVPSERGK